jgi:hypothetical protein
LLFYFKVQTMQKTGGGFAPAAGSERLILLDCDLS